MSDDEQITLIARIAELYLAPLMRSPFSENNPSSITPNEYTMPSGEIRIAPSTLETCEISSLETGIGVITVL